MTLQKVGVEFEAKIKKYQEQIKEAVSSTEKGQAKIVSALVRTEKAALNLAAVDETASARRRIAQDRVAQSIKRTSTVKEVETIKVKKAEQQLQRESIKTAQAQKKLSQSMDRTTRSSKTQSTAIGGLTSRLGVLAAAIFSASAITRLEDAWLKAEVQIDATTDSVEEAFTVQVKLKKIANTLGTSYTDLANVFGRFKRATSELGTTSEDIISVTENISKALLLEGNSANEVNSVIIQLSQGLRAGILAGDEFRAVSESSSIILKSLADQMGVNVSDLKKLGSQGKITAETLIEATKNMEVNGDALDKATSTWSATWNRLSTAVGFANDTFQDFIPVSNIIKGFLEGLAWLLNTSAMGWQALGIVMEEVNEKIAAVFSGGADSADRITAATKKAKTELKALRDSFNETEKLRKGGGGGSGGAGDVAEEERIAKLDKIQEKADIRQSARIESRLARSKKELQTDLQNLEESKAKELAFIEDAQKRAVDSKLKLAEEAFRLDDDFEKRKADASGKALERLNKNQAKEFASFNRAIEEKGTLEQKLADQRLAIIADYNAQKEAINQKANEKAQKEAEKILQAEVDAALAIVKENEKIETLKDEAAQREVERIEQRLERSRQSRQNDLENLEESLTTEQEKIAEALERGILTKIESKALLLQVEEEFLLAKDELALSEEEKLVARLERELEMYQQLNDDKLISDETLYAAKEKLEFEGVKAAQSTAVKGFQSKTKLNSAEVKFTLEGLDAMGKKSESAAKASFFIKKAQKLSEAFVSTAAGVAEALPNFPLAAAVAIAGGAQIAAIASQSFGGSGGGASGGLSTPDESEAASSGTEAETSTLDVTERSGSEITTTRLIIETADGQTFLDGIATGLDERKRRE